MMLKLSFSLSLNCFRLYCIQIRPQINYPQQAILMHCFAIFLFALLSFTAFSLMNFQRIIWLYWQTDINQAPLVTKISYERLVDAAKSANWTLNLVTADNIHTFVPEYEQFEAVVSKGYRKTVQQKSDILRITLIEAHGGVWIDFAAILFQDLAWLSDDSIFQHLIINRIGVKTQDPDMLMLGEAYHQSPLSYYNKDGVLVTDEYFGMAIHFVAAKKKSPIMKAWKQKMYHLTTLSYSQFVPYIHQKRLYFHNIDHFSMYYSGNLALEAVIQEKQMQFDGMMNWKLKRANAYEMYNIWMVHGEVGPLLLTRKQFANARDLFMDTREEIEKRAGKIWFYLKLGKLTRQEIEDKQKPTEDYISTKNLTVEQILSRGPTYQQCQLIFIVQGSILHNFYHNSKHSSSIKTPFITVEQRQQLKSHCWYKAPSIYLPSHTYKSEGQMTRPERELVYGQVKNFGDWVGLWWQANCLVFWAWFEWFRTLLYVTVAYAVVKYGIFRVETKMIRQAGTEDELSTDGDIQSKSVSCLSARAKFRFIKPQFRQVAFVTSFIFIASAILQFYEQLQDMGKYPQYQCTLLAILLVFLTRGILKKLINSRAFTSTPKFFNLHNLMIDTRPIIYLPLGFCVFLHLDIVYGFAYQNTVVIVGGSLLLYALLEELDERQMSYWGLKIVMKVMKLIRWPVIGVFLTFYFVPNLRYIRDEHRYFKEILSVYAKYIFWIFFISTITAVIFNLSKKLRVLNHQKRSQHNDSHRQKKKQILHMIFSAISIIILTIQSSITYSKILQAPSTHYVMADFQIIFVVYTLFAISLRQKLIGEQKLLERNVMILSSAIPILYMFFGVKLFKFMEIVPESWIFFRLLPLYVALVISLQEKVNKNEFKKLQSGGSEMFHEVQLSPDTSKY